MLCGLYVMETENCFFGIHNILFNKKEILIWNTELTEMRTKQVF